MFLDIIVSYFTNSFCTLSLRALEIDYSDCRGMAGMQSSHIQGYTRRAEMAQKCSQITRNLI
jgi:hypothetical protein